MMFEFVCEIHRCSPSLLSSASHWPATLLSVVRFAAYHKNLSSRAFKFLSELSSPKEGSAAITVYNYLSICDALYLFGSLIRTNSGDPSNGILAIDHLFRFFCAAPQVVQGYSSLSSPSLSSSSSSSSSPSLSSSSSSPLMTSSNEKGESDVNKSIEEKRERETRGEGRSLLWDDFWFPTLEYLSRFCLDSRPGVRGHALTKLQHALLSAELRNYLVRDPNPRIAVCFEEIIFVLLDRVLAPSSPSSPSSSSPFIPSGPPSSFARSPTIAATHSHSSPLSSSPSPPPSTSFSSPLNVGEVVDLQLRLLTLLSKTFLHVWYLPSTSPALSPFSQQQQQQQQQESTTTIFDLWLKVLAYLKKMCEVGSDQEAVLLREAVAEHIKNMMLVMSASGVWQGGRDGVEGARWRLSLRDMALWCPALKDILVKFVDA
eukprot:CAMPEP_0201502766 /NCGR_PEP_ID=MMETSP0151_2-20130828/84309_1 /ASSEMBLY_ACC=CAM_ASM_000257 /TAXON_ID=200890 /ORGANISM="Paramoeba atlantica, Strain 621/1 / CCAP 1560/9" /LENGTH=429 /DNA_ID=CAMNT_0047896389 /DNA_START=874 /DNA_END=2163 /DNA_ORIENTATION=+